ncbi:MAG: PIN domain-containing protein [Microthrixaceae bacterium]
MTDVFVDTNVLVYAFDRSDPYKQHAARGVLEGPDVLVVSTQVLLEFFVVVTRKLDPPTPAKLARAAVDELAKLRVVSADAALVQRAVDTSITHQMSVWDAMILEAAAETGCATIFTEDLSAGSTIRGIQIVDPFAT